MKVLRFLFIAVLATSSSGCVPQVMADCTPHLDQEARKLGSSERIKLCTAFSGAPFMVVNTASHCGFTSQFGELEALYQAYKSRGFKILGVPSNDFQQAAQDEDTGARICYLNFGVTFTMLSPQHVRGQNAHPLFQELTRKAGGPDWNFNKYLLDRNGDLVQRFGSNAAPMSRAVRKAVEALLQASHADRP